MIFLEFHHKISENPGFLLENISFHWKFQKLFAEENPCCQPGDDGQKLEWPNFRKRIVSDIHKKTKKALEIQTNFLLFV